MAGHDAVLEALRTVTKSVQQQYKLTDEQVQQALFSETIPATIFRADATPLESVISYLSSTGRSATHIAKSLGRNSAYITTILKRGTKHSEPDETTIQLPIHILKGTSAGKAITTYLSEQGLATKDIAKLMCKNESTVWSWKKRGEQP